MKTKKQLLIQLLKRGWASPLAALHYAGTMKLSTRAGELKAEGYKVVNRWHTSKNYKEYRIVK